MFTVKLAHGKCTIAHLPETQPILIEWSGTMTEQELEIVYQTIYKFFSVRCSRSILINATTLKIEQQAMHKRWLLNIGLLQAFQVGFTKLALIDSDPTNAEFVSLGKFCCFNDYDNAIAWLTNAKCDALKAIAA